MKTDNRTRPVGFSAGLVTITLAATTTLLHTVSVERIAHIVKLILTNRGAASTRVLIGDTADGLVGGAFTARLAHIWVPPNGNIILDEAQLPKVFDRFHSDFNIFGQISAATTLDISGEVEEEEGGDA